MREAETAFGDRDGVPGAGRRRPRHIEVQILADAHGRRVHLFERDCSVQRRHQKVIEIAPGPDIDESCARPSTATPSRFAKSIGYVNAGTVEFLVDTRASGRARLHRDEPPHPGGAHRHGGDHRRRPRAVADAHRRRGDASATSASARRPSGSRGVALQCRITTEDPANGFRPDNGPSPPTAPPAGAGIRLDGGTVYTGAEVIPHFDSMLVKLTCRGRDFADRGAPARRALAEFRVRGVTTNIPFLMNVLDDPTSWRGRHHRLHRGATRTRSRAPSPRTAAPRSCNSLADVTVNQPNGRGRGHRPASSCRRPETSPSRTEPLRRPLARSRPQAGDRPARTGPGRLRRGAARADRLAVTDTTFRDAHQSLLATRVRTQDLLRRRCRPSRTSRPSSLGGGVGRGHLRRRAAVPRRGPVGAPRQLRERSRTSPCRCCCAVATRSATRPTPWR